MRMVFGVVVAATLLPGAARAELMWTVVDGDDHAFIAVIDAADVEEPEAHYPFSMTCSPIDGDQTTVSDIDPEKLGAAIAADEVPTFRLVLDGDAANAIGEIADIHFGQMEGVWEYVSYNAPYDLLLGATAITIDGVGVSLDLPGKDMTASMAVFATACDRIHAMP